MRTLAAHGGNTAGAVVESDISDLIKGGGAKIAAGGVAFMRSHAFVMAIGRDREARCAFVGAILKVVCEKIRSAALTYFLTRPA